MQPAMIYVRVVPFFPISVNFWISSLFSNLFATYPQVSYISFLVPPTNAYRHRFLVYCVFRCLIHSSISRSPLASTYRHFTSLVLCYTYLIIYFILQSITDSSCLVDFLIDSRITGTLFCVERFQIECISLLCFGYPHFSYHDITIQQSMDGQYLLRKGHFQDPLAQKGQINYS